MAAKADTVKLLQEIRGYAEITNRRAVPRPIDLPLAQYRPHILRAALPIYKRWIRVEARHCPEADVKITWLKASEAPSLLPPQAAATQSVARPLP